MPPEIRQQLRKYYLYSFLLGTWFASAIWVFFSRKFLTDTSIGIIDAIALGIGLLAEVPSGTIADVFGRRRTVIAGTIIYVVGYGLWGFSVNGWMAFFGIMLTAVGNAFQSGADEAMMYDYLKAHNQEKIWARVSVNRTILARFAFIFALMIGGFSYTVYDRLPFLFRTLTLLLMLIPLFQLKILDSFQEGEGERGVDSQYLLSLKQGIKELFSSKARWLVPLFFLVQGCAYMIFTAGVLRSLLYEKSGLAIEYHSYAISFALVLSVMVMFGVRRWSSALSQKIGLYSFSFVCFLGFLATIGNQSLAISLLGLTVLQIATYSLIPLLSTALNQHVSSKYRATSISAASFLQGALYIVVAPIIGWLSFNGQINLVAISMTVLVLLGIIISALLSDKKTLPT